MTRNAELGAFGRVLYTNILLGGDGISAHDCLVPISTGTPAPGETDDNLRVQFCLLMHGAIFMVLWMPNKKHNLNSMQSAEYSSKVRRYRALDFLVTI